MAELPARLDTVLHVIYLVFNEGYAASSGPLLIRHDLSAEAILLVELLPDPEAIGLLAPCCCTTRVRPPARHRTASPSCSTTRTARCGTSVRSPRAWS